MKALIVATLILSASSVSASGVLAPMRPNYVAPGPDYSNMHQQRRNTTTEIYRHNQWGLRDLNPSYSVDNNTGDVYRHNKWGLRDLNPSWSISD